MQPYRDASPVFTRYGVEAQLDAMFSPQVTLKSGGYIVINQTEALVAIDVNSGKATREQILKTQLLRQIWKQPKKYLVSCAYVILLALS